MNAPGDKAAMLVSRLQKNERRLRPWAARLGLEAFRLYDRDIPELPFAIDLYGRAAVFQVFVPRHGAGPAFVALAEACAAAVAELPFVDDDRVFTKAREVARGGTQYASAGRGVPELEPALFTPARFSVREGPCRFLVNLEDHLDTGLFLDHRALRRRVGEECRGKRVLNLFGYTGAFAVHAGVGGAAHVLSLDLSSSYTRWCAQNFAHNGLSSDRCQAEQADVLAWLERAPSAPSDCFDCVVMDPPSVSRSRRATRDLDVQRDHRWLLSRALLWLAPGGVLYFSTNLSGFVLQPPTENGAIVDVEVLTTQTQSPDFPRGAHQSFRLRRG